MSASLYAFSITWGQLKALQSLPRPLPARGYPYHADAELIDKGLADVQRDGIQITPEGMAMRNALVEVVGGFSRRAFANRAAG